jgi:hypothetical protein
MGDSSHKCINREKPTKISAAWAKKQKVLSEFDVDCKVGNHKAFIKMSVKNNRMCVSQK